MPISGSTKAKMYAVHGIHRIGASRIGYFGPQLFILATEPSVDEAVYNLLSLQVLKSNLKVDQRLGDTPDTAVITVRSSTAAPVGIQPGSGIRIALGTVENIIFDGHVLKITQVLRTANQRFPRWTVECVDQSWMLDFTRLAHSGGFSGPLDQAFAQMMSANAANVAAFFPFTLSAESGLPETEVVPQFMETITELLSRVTKSAGAYWRLDPKRVIRIFRNADAHATLDNTSNFWDLSYGDDISQVRGTTWVIGGGTVTTQDFTPGDSVLHVQDVVTYFSSIGNHVLVMGRLVDTQGYTDGADPTLTLTGIAWDFPIPAGTPVQVTGVGIGSGILNGVVADRAGSPMHVLEDNLLDADGAEFRGEVDVAIFQDGFTSITFKTRDPRFVAGRKISVNLPNIASFVNIGVGGVGDFLIQSVTIEGASSDTVMPVRSVTLGTFQRNLSELLSRLGRIIGSPPRTARI